MKIIIQRVKEAQVTVQDKIIGKIGKGFLVLLGIAEDDTEKEAEYLVKKLTNLRIFEDENDKMNLSIKEVKGSLLIVSQFTLYGDCKKGNRPSFVNAARPEIARPLYEFFIQKCKEENLLVEHGEFGAHMEVSLVNDGPVTIEIKAEK